MGGGILCRVMWLKSVARWFEIVVRGSHRRQRTRPMASRVCVEKAHRGVVGEGSGRCDGKEVWTPKKSQIVPKHIFFFLLTARVRLSRPPHVH
jgi:hypothetical protein